MIHACETWRHLLIGSPHPIIVQVDHKNLTYYKQTNKVTPRQARWLQFLQDFDLFWEYMPGSKLIQADALSRRGDHVDSDEDNDDKYYVLVTPERIISQI